MKLTKQDTRLRRARRARKDQGAPPVRCRAPDAQHIYAKFRSRGDKVWLRVDLQEESRA